MTMEIPPGSVTTADVYRKLEDISVSVIRFRYSLMGAAVLAGTLAGVASGWLSGGVHH